MNKNLAKELYGYNTLQILRKVASYRHLGTLSRERTATESSKGKQLLESPDGQVVGQIQFWQLCPFRYLEV